MRILIAEDDLTARTILAGILKKSGYDVLAVQDGLAAWELLQEPDSPSLVILDWMMPGMDGPQVIRRVRGELTGKQPYIILLTSKDDKGDLLSGLDSGANDYIKKPFDHEELNARVRVGERTMSLQASLYETQRTLEHLATHDPLTGILNRRAILEQLAKELARAGRARSTPMGNTQTPNKETRLSTGFFDVDHFKTINDRFGHQAGDEVLCGLVHILRDRVRLYDSIGRLGGDEFLVVMPGLDESNRGSLFERLASAVACTPLMTCAGELTVQVSIGVATAEVDSSVDRLLERADAAMYRAKREGGNRVCYAEPGCARSCSDRDVADRGVM